MGYYAQEQGNLEEAIEHYKNAIELTPGHFKAYNNLGNCYIRTIPRRFSCT